MRPLTFDIVDFHAHILPSADHGSDSVETTLWQLASAAACGVKRIFATPHFYPNSHTVESFIRTRDEAYRKLSEALPAGMPEIKLGAEVLICEGLENLPDLSRLFINGTTTLLLELPFAGYREEYGDCVGILTKRGVNVIMAHAERYPSAYSESMIKNGASLQVNSRAILKDKRARAWLERGVVSAIGTDIHMKDKRAYPKLVKAINKLGEYANTVKERSDAIWSEAL